MDIIKLLSDAVANQIAAGEVVQRPASVVKELLENAVDAGATTIQLIVKDAGRTLIQVIDNGKGMSFNDARMCFERHATSKLQSADDLYHITTKGFRGEAMASIAAIAHVELKTKRPEEPTGTLVLMEGSQVKAHEVIATQDGTSVSVKNLFFNVPARRNFLKSDNVEMTHIEEEFYRVALIHHDLEFSLYHNGKALLQLQPSNFKQRIIHIFGNHFKEKLYPVEQSTEFMSISGFIAKPENAKKKKSEQYMFINHRYVRHNLLNYAVETAYQELIPQGYRPAYFIEIEIDPSAIDINVSPTKVEVKLQDEKLMFGFLNAAVKKSLGTMSLTPQLDFDTEQGLVPPERPAGHPIVMPSTGVNPNYNPFDTVPARPKTSGSFGGFSSGNASWKEQTSMGGWDDFLKGLNTQTVENNEGRQLESEELISCADEESKTVIPEDLEFFVMGGRYVFFKQDDQAFIVDVLNARERILYDRYLSALDSTPIRVQQSLFPDTITLTPAQADLADSLKEDFRKLGYELEKMDNTHFAVNGTPNDGENGDIQSLIENALDSFKSNQFLYRADKNRNMAICMARQNRSRYPVPKSAPEVRAFLEELFRCDCPATSPSEKSILHIIGTEELKRYFE